MFELIINKQDLLVPLLTVAGAVDKKQAMPILGNILLSLQGNELSLTATDLEIEITGKVHCVSSNGDFKTTVPAKKMIDIVRSLDEDANITITFDTKIISIKAGRSQFKLTTLSANDYPNTEEELNQLELSLPREVLIRLFQSTHFAMSQQDVRVFFNSLFLEFDAQFVTAVATDGHRLAVCKWPLPFKMELHRLLLPRKGVQEVSRLLHHVSDETIAISAGSNHFKLITDQYVFSSKLVEARFPPYTKAIPRDHDKQVIIDCDLLKRALTRTVILAHEKFKSVLLQIELNQLTLLANNQEQEEAVEILEAKTEGDGIKIGLNASYLLDVLAYFGGGTLRLSLLNTDSSILVESIEDENYKYIIMPMKL